MKFGVLLKRTPSKILDPTLYTTNLVRAVH